MNVEKERESNLSSVVQKHRLRVTVLGAAGMAWCFSYVKVEHLVVSVLTVMC